MDFEQYLHKIGKLGIAGSDKSVNLLLQFSLLLISVAVIVLGKTGLALAVLEHQVANL
jgi:hypothetical protein